MSNANCRAQIVERKIDNPPMNITFPEIRGLQKQDVQEKINMLIEQTVAKIAE